jgi:DNA topoisomerase-3
MSKTLVLAEKPSVGRDIGRVLNCSKKNNGYLENNKYIVTWALGHLVTLATPEKYGDKYKTWSMDNLPMLPSKLKLEVIKKTSKQFHLVKKLLNKSDVTNIIIATDAGREGELVARWIIEMSHVKKPIKRLWISSVTDKAIKDGFKNIKDGKLYNNLYNSALARAEADWLIGLNASRALTCKYNAQLSCGRVQTPTLSIIAKREAEITNFKPKKYYGIKADTGSFILNWHDSNNNNRIYDKDKCDKILASIGDKNATVVNTTKKAKKAFAPSLYDLTELQRDANKIYDFSAKETLSIMQKLYEHYKVVTYPRTDSRYITTDIIETLEDRVKACKIKPYSKFVTSILNKPIKTSKSFVDNSKVSDHHAIIPTEESAYINDMSDKERKIYDLIVRRFLAVLYPPYEYSEVTINCTISEELFSVKGTTPINIGWKQIYEGTFNDNNITLPNVSTNDTINISSMSKTENETKPPARFNEATLLSAMENPKKYMQTDNKELLKTINETGGLGTVATRADIIGKLYNNYLIENRGKEIIITSKGKQLLDLVPNDIKSPELTAIWEEKLAQISKGSLNKNEFISNMKDYTKVIVRDIKNSDKQFKHNNITGNRCPECGKFLLEVKGKRGKTLVCQDRECGYKKLLSQLSNARCPNCHKKLELHGEGTGKIFICKCGYREKLSAFNERKKSNKGTTSKKEVAKYLKKQNKQKNEAVNSDLAKALEKFNIK